MVPAAQTLNRAVNPTLRNFTVPRDGLYQDLLFSAFRRLNCKIASWRLQQGESPQQEHSLSIFTFREVLLTTLHSTHSRNVPGTRGEGGSLLSPLIVKCLMFVRINRNNAQLFSLSWTRPTLALRQRVSASDLNFPFILIDNGVYDCCFGATIRCP